MNLVDRIIDYESGTMTELQKLYLFSDLIKSGECWSLQGAYGRTATAYINGSLIEKDGTITELGKELAEDEDNVLQSGLF